MWSEGRKGEQGVQKLPDTNPYFANQHAISVITERINNGTIASCAIY